MNAETSTVLFAGGGTGGHIFPNLAIAERLTGRGDIAVPPRVHFAVSNRPLDARIMTQQNLPFTPLGVRPLPRRPWHIPGFLRSYFQSRAEAMRLMREKNVRVVIATGGFVSAPVIAAARKLGIARLMVNLDAVPGVANRYLAPSCTRVFSVYASPKLPGATIVPLPLRRSCLSSGDAASCKKALKLEGDRPVLLITGASQGAESLNKLMMELIGRDEFRAAVMGRGWQVLHIAGEDRAEPVKQAYKQAGIDAVVMAFCNTMGLAWGAADVCLSRAGASSVGEVAANAVPTIFLPYPYHKDQHQKLNAQPLVEAGGSLMYDDLIEPKPNGDQLEPVLLALMNDASRRNAMRAKLHQLAGQDGASILADEAMKTIAG